MDKICRRYTFKLYPTTEQAAILHEHRYMMVDLWNALLQRHEDVYRREKRNLTRFDLEYEITDLYRECPEWRALSTWCARRVNVALANAFQAFFRRVKQGAGAQSGYPRYKRRRDGDRIPHRCASGCRLALRERSDGMKSPGSARNWCLTLKGVPSVIHARGCFPVGVDKFTDADVLWRDGRWWFSICVEMAPRRISGTKPAVIELGIIDGLARVDGDTETPAELLVVQMLQDQLDTWKAARDQRWPKPARVDQDWIDVTRDISRLAARIARKRRNALHVWSAQLVRRANDLTVNCPSVATHTASPRGDRKKWGANVETVSKLNRNTLSKAPAMAAAMLTYKAKEAGIRCDVIENIVPDIAIGAAMVATGQELRHLALKTRRSTYAKERSYNRPSGHPRRKSST